MMTRSAHNPGSIHVRLGALQAKMEEAVAAGNLVLYANLLRRMKVYASVYMGANETATYDEMPGLSEDERTADQVYDHLCAKEEYLLAIFQDHDVFTKGQHEKGDASSLDDEEELVAA